MGNLIYCITKSGERIIVEIQRAFQQHIKERSLFYSSFAIQEQAKRGEWNFQLNAVYCVSILDFAFKTEHPHDGKYLHKVKLIDEETGKVFNDKLTFIYIEVPNFKKKPEELETKFEKWVYLLKDLEYLERLPERFKEKIFSKVMDIASITKLEKKDRKAYEDSLKIYRDLKNVLDSSFEQGIEQGIEQGENKKVKVGSINFFKNGVPVNIIAQSLEVSEATVNKILKDAGLIPENGYH
jgi:predicted transposase/invertase (TIGR01784 family)